MSITSHTQSDKKIEYCTKLCNKIIQYIRMGKGNKNRNRNNCSEYTLEEVITYLEECFEEFDCKNIDSHRAAFSQCNHILKNFSYYKITDIPIKMIEQFLSKTTEVKCNCYFIHEYVQTMYDEILKYYVPSHELTRKIMYRFVGSSINIFNNSKFVPTNEIVLEAFELFSKRPSLFLHQDLADFLWKYHEIIQTPIDDLLLKLVQTKNKHAIQKTAMILEKMLPKNTVKINLINKACESLPDSMPIVDLLFKHGFNIDSELLGNICRRNSPNTIQYVLKASNILPNNNHFKKILEGYTDAAEKIDVLCNFGYMLAQDDILLLIKEKKDISKTTNRLNIKLNDICFKECREETYFPDYKFENVSDEMIELYRKCLSARNLLKTKNELDIIYKEIEAHIKKYNLTPDNTCMFYMLWKGDKDGMDILVNAGGRMTIECFREYCDCLLNDYHVYGKIRRAMEITEIHNKEIVDSLNDKLKLLEERYFRLQSIKNTPKNDQ